MCGIVGGVTNEDITSLLLEGLNRLEYRGYDSSGLIVLSKNNTFERARSIGRVKNLEDNLKARILWSRHYLLGLPRYNYCHKKRLSISFRNWKKRKLHCLRSNGTFICHQRIYFSRRGRCC